jgi:hypothetical protein
MISLQSIKFNHNSGSCSTDALAIRRNASQTVNVPEWVDGVSVNPEDSPAAYSIADTNGNTITIQARLRSTNPEIRRIQVRALDPVTDPPGETGCAGFIAKLIRRFIKAVAGNVLGEVQERWVDLAAGDSGFVSFNLINTNLANARVSKRTTEWRWQYRLNAGDPWQELRHTLHRIYVVLGTPTLPWVQTAGSTQLPWTEVLDYACDWGILANTPDEAGAKVTERVYALGPGTMAYDCPGGGATHYALGSFDCTKFLELLRGGPGNGDLVNCTDCATILSTFANILGCDLWQSRMQSGFKLNPFIAIGYNAWYPGCSNWLGTSFSYHEVAWKGGCTASDAVFDACLQLDADAMPDSAPHTPMLATNMVFGDCSSLGYRLRLSPNVAGGCSNCNPAPGSRQRRALI